ncbi:sulfotransferase [Oceaniferula spumae]|uniref:Sulfotransferase n=1 Tax=Oceaniferula spumae TaxID=2979115 RepID=A0AAT9FJ99_9BACT
MEVGETFLRQATQFMGDGDLSSALASLHQATESGINAEQTHKWLVVLHTLYCFCECEKLAGSLMENPDVRTEQLLSAARLFFEISRYKIATDLTRQVNELQPGNPDTLAILASCLERDGMNDQAKQFLHESIAIDPSHVRTTRMLAHLERRDSDFASARIRLEKHLQQYPSSDDWRLQYELAAVLDRLGEHCRAMQVLCTAKAQLAPYIEMQAFEKMSTRQWEIVQQLTSERLRKWNSNCELKPNLRLCLLAGFPRSGTTLLENILISHIDCVGTDETGIMFSQFTDPLIMQAETASEGIEELDSFNADELSAGRYEFLRCTEEYIQEAVDGRWLIEKEPLLTANLAVPMRLFPDAKIIMPLRDPRDVVISYFFTLVPVGVSSLASVELGETCRFYASVMRHWLYLKQVIPEAQWLELRYEDLLENPETQTRKLADFLAIEWSDALLSHHKNLSERKVSTPTYDDVSKPLYKRSIARWKNYEEALAPHLHYLKPYIEAFGYE